MKRRVIHVLVTIVLITAMCATAIALWRGVIPIEWLSSLGYKGIFILSLVNGIAPVAGPSQIATFFVAGKLNPLGVGMAAGIGGAFGELAGYAVGYSLRAAQTEEVERKIQRVADWRFLKITRERSFLPLFLLAAFPNPFFDPASALAGSLKIGLGRYFVPVLLGKVARHLVIAYVGYYTITGAFSSLDKESVNMFLTSGVFIGVVIGIAALAWLVRSVFEWEPDPFLLNFTFFAFAGQGILTAELIREGKQHGFVLVMVVPAIILLLFQTFVIRAQVERTQDHYAKLLADNKIGHRSDAEIDQWASVLVRITGVDFFPEFYLNWIKFGSPREKRRRQAVLTIPRELFKAGQEGVTPEALLLKPDDRRFLWRCYAGTCLSSWIVFIVCIIAAR